MATSSSPLAFADCYSALDRALASHSGIRLRFLSEGDAKHFRTRLHAARQLHRNGNREVYASDHPMHGCSEYDALTVKARAAKVGQLDGEWLLLIEKVEKPLTMEEIEGEHTIVESLPEPEPQLAIEDKSAESAPDNKIDRRI